MRKTTYFFCGLLPLLWMACSRNVPTPLVSQNNITSFILKASDNQSYLTKDLAAKITGDTIQLLFDSGTVISGLKPTILYSGKSIDPESRSPEDFSKPVPYVVTAEDGSTHSYVTAVTFISPSQVVPGDKKILSFTFRSSDNPGLKSDVTGLVQGDSIFLLLPAGTPLSNLTPFITFSGKSLSPASSIPVNFSNPVKYNVEAADGTIHTYIVTVTVPPHLLHVNGTVFVVGVNSASMPSLDSGAIFALDAATGNLKWKYMNDGYISSEPTITNGLLYSNDTKGNIFALDINTGRVVWNYSSGPSIYIHSNPIVSDNRVYVCGSDSALYALDALNGSLIWKYNRAWGSPTAAYGNIYCISDGIVALDANTGMQNWKINPSSDPSYLFPSNPAVVNGILYVGCIDHNLYAMDAYTGSLIWSYNGAEITRTSPTVVNGIVYFSAGPGGTIFAVDANTGKRIWSNYVGNSGSSSPTIANGSLYVGNNNQYLYALDANTGALKWNLSDGNWIDESPLFFQGVIYVGAQEEFQAVDALTGKFIWTFSNDRLVMQLACAVDSLGQVYHTSESGEQN